MHVKCRNVYDRKYLTDKKIYKVIAKPGDESKALCGTVSPYGFEVISDTGNPIYCLFNDCCHADWQIVSEKRNPFAFWNKLKSGALHNAI